MLKWNYVPLKLHTGSTILIYKGKGHESDIGNWRPITIFSVLRRIIERSLDQELRSHIQLTSHQRDFVTGITGTHINASIVNGVLKTAKTNKSSGCVVFLDITKAFDTSGHNHIKQTIESLPIPPNLRSLVFSLIFGNNITVEVNKKSSKPINMRRGVTQGSPLSPTIFNICQDFVLKQISNPGVAIIHGFQLNDNLDNISVIGFTDDTTIIAKDLESATVLVDMTRDLFSSVGMQINPSKSHAINIENGNLMPKVITLLDSSVIPSLDDTNRIKYLGINFIC